MRRASTVAERRAAAEELQRRMDAEFGQQREGSELKGATGDGVLLEEELHPVERVPTPEPVVRDRKHRRTSTGAVRIRCSMRVGATCRSRRSGR